ncbi:MAG: HutD family protein [Rubrivivax sp.]|jgi:environmental stress-induced protein Ves
MTLPVAQQQVAALQAPPQPWKNGGGVTRHLAHGGVGPAGGEAWAWRISLADVAADGPFSAYPGVQRWFAVVDGGGVQLRFENRLSRLTPDSAALHFDGAEAPHCSLLTGPTRDLNLMLQAGARGEMQRGTHFNADWPQRGCYDPATHTLHWGFAPGPLQWPHAVLWLGVDEGGVA